MFSIPHLQKTRMPPKRIAMLISGRAARYEVALLKILEKSNYHNIDLFMSINDTNKDCKYYQTMKVSLKKWLKYCYINEYKDDEFFELFDNNIANCFNVQLVNNKPFPLYLSSMWWNWQNAFNMATNYADSNNFEYDCYMVFRSDIVGIEKIPDNLPTDDNTLYYPIPPCMFAIEPGKNIKCTGNIVNDQWAWGSRKIMTVYCNTYDFIINQYKKFKGHYYVSSEVCLTHNIRSNNINEKFFTKRQINYGLDLNRKVFDNINIDKRDNGFWTGVWAGKKLLFVDINNVEKDLSYIPSEKQH